jgi:hypothetical protein
MSSKSLQGRMQAWVGPERLLRDAVVEAFRCGRIERVETTLGIAAVPAFKTSCDDSHGRTST